MELKIKTSPGDWAACNFAWASAIVDSLVAVGVRHVILSPGAQMAPIALACRQNKLLDCTVVVDERSAAFEALGLARGSRRPTLVVCTSGSAVGHYYPAVMEANVGMIPLIVLTCDKNPEEHGRSTAQVFDQDRAYATHVRAFHTLHVPEESIGLVPTRIARLVERSLWPTPGPVQLNVSFRPPLIPEGRSHTVAIPLPPRVPRPHVPVEEGELSLLSCIVSGTPGVIVCGPGELGREFSEAVGALAAALQCPLFADACSGLRFGPHDRSALVTHGDSFLRRESSLRALRPSWVLRFGGTPSSAALLGWLDGSGAREQIVVDDTEQWPDPLPRARTTRIIRANPTLACQQLAKAIAPCRSGWLELFKAEDRRSEWLLQRFNREAGKLWEAQAIRGLMQSLGDGDAVMVGNSMPVRDFDAYSGTGPQAVRVVCKRGTNGIDGNIAFLIGLARTNPGRTVGVIGDLAFAHDVGALQMGAGKNVTLIVVNNGGGAIFEYQATEGIPEFGDFLADPGIDIAAAVRAFGWGHTAARSAAEFATALDQTLDARGPGVIELVVDRAASVASHRAFAASVVAAEPMAFEEPALVLSAAAE